MRPVAISGVHFNFRTALWANKELVAEDANGVIRCSPLDTANATSSASTHSKSPVDSTALKNSNQLSFWFACALSLIEIYAEYGANREAPTFRGLSKAAESI